MKRLKKFYRNNRIYCILMIVSLICLIVIGASVITYFLSLSKESVYGPREENVNNHKTSKDISKLEEYFNTNDKVTSATVRQQNKIIYMDIYVKDDISKEEIQTIATSALDLVEEKNREFYDYQFVFIRPKYSAYFGYKNSGSDLIVWGNEYEVGEVPTTTTASKKKGK